MNDLVCALYTNSLLINDYSLYELLHILFYTFHKGKCITLILFVSSI